MDLKPIHRRNRYGLNRDEATPVKAGFQSTIAATPAPLIVPASAGEIIHKYELH